MTARDALELSITERLALRVEAALVPVRHVLDLVSHPRVPREERERRRRRTAEGHSAWGKALCNRSMVSRLDVDWSAPVSVLGMPAFVGAALGLLVHSWEASFLVSAVSATTAFTILWMTMFCFLSHLQFDEHAIFRLRFVNEKRWWVMKTIRPVARGLSRRHVLDVPARRVLEARSSSTDEMFYSIFWPGSSAELLRVFEELCAREQGATREAVESLLLNHEGTVRELVLTARLV